MTNNSTDTPRTDALDFGWGVQSDEIWDLSRQLELELAISLENQVKAKSEVERLLTISKIIVEYISEYEPRQFYRDLINKNTK